MRGFTQIGMTPRTGLEVAFRACKEAPNGGEGRRGAVPPLPGLVLFAQAAAAEREGAAAIGVTVASHDGARRSSQRSNSSLGIGRE